VPAVFRIRNSKIEADPDWESVSRSKQAKILPQKKEKIKKFIFEELSDGLEASPGIWISFVGVS